MYYPDYLIHYNKNHSKANGQFVSGDGDGDGISNDHAHRSENGSRKTNKIDSRYHEAKKVAGKKMGVGKGLMIGGLGGAAASAGLDVIAQMTNNEMLEVASYVSGCGSIVLSGIGAVVFDRGRKIAKQAATKALLDSATSGNRQSTEKYLRERDKYTDDDVGSTYYRQRRY